MSKRLLVASAMATACAPEPELRYIDVGVDVRLNAVAELGNSFIAVGSGGVVVDGSGQQWDLGDVELMARR